MTRNNPTLAAVNQGIYSVNVLLNIPIGDLQFEQRIVRARIAQERVRLDILQNTDDLNIQVQNAVRDIQFAWEEIRLAQESKRLAQQQLRAELTLLNFKKSDGLSVSIAEDDLVRAENDEARAKIAYLNELTNLDQIMGMTLERWGIDLEQRVVVRGSE